MPKTKSKKNETVAEKVAVRESPTPATKSHKEELLELYQVLKDKNIRSISDLEVQIARAE